MNPGLRAEWGGKKNVLVTHPLSEKTGCTLSKKVDIPSGKRTCLHLVVTHDPRGDWTLLVKADGVQLAVSQWAAWGDSNRYQLPRASQWNAFGVAHGVVGRK